MVRATEPRKQSNRARAYPPLNQYLTPMKSVTLHKALLVAILVAKLLAIACMGWVLWYTNQRITRIEQQLHITP
jgi:hypothetical protein